ncbi:MAG: cupin domain-containing protein [Sporolactobacillus sp.]
MVRVSEQLKDYGPQPLVVNIEKATEINPNYRTAIWTGKYLQVTLMSINPGEDIGLEIHPMTDQFLRVEEGNGLVQMGETSNQLTYQQPVSAGFAIIVPASTWHNVVNTGSKPLKLYSIYAPPHHPHGTLQKTKAIAETEEGSATHRPF